MSAVPILLRAHSLAPDSLHNINMGVTRRAILVKDLIGLKFHKKNHDYTVSLLLL